MKSEGKVTDATSSVLKFLLMSMLFLNPIALVFMRNVLPSVFIGSVADWYPLLKAIFWYDMLVMIACVAQIYELAWREEDAHMQQKALSLQ